LNPVVKEKTLQKLEWLKSQGHTVEAVDFPLLKYILPVYYILTTAEASSNLARYDGVRYGFRSENTKDLESLYKKTKNEGFGAEVKRRIMLGTFVLSADYYDAYYTKAQRVRRLIRERTLEILSDCDAIIIPTTSSAAFKIGEKSKDPIAMYLADLFTVQANLAGTPALSVPFCNHPENGMPIGFQIIGKPMEDEKVMALGKLIMEIQNH
jgi:aspartyl-tRNA(Asn)/glutamyl-tRNA(Gln) amidotransferase subunit A